MTTPTQESTTSEGKPESAKTDAPKADAPKADAKIELKDEIVESQHRIVINGEAITYSGARLD